MAARADQIGDRAQENNSNSHAHAHTPASPSFPPSISTHGRRHSLTLGMLSSLWSSTTASLSYHDASEDEVTAAAAAAAPGRSRSSRHTSVSSQPVLVRTYSGSRRSKQRQQQQQQQHVRFDASPAMAHNAKLPAVNAFGFDEILRAVDPEISASIDAIAEICAKSKLSLADEYSAHLPPQGEITTDLPRGRQHPYIGDLAAVPEASSSSERLAGESRPSTASEVLPQTAYGSLRSIISGSRLSRPAINTAAAAGNQGSSDNIVKRGIDARGAFAAEVGAASSVPASRLALAPHWTFTPHRPTAMPLSVTPGAAKQLSPVISSPGTDMFTLPTPIITRESFPRETLARKRSNSLTSWLPWAKAPEPVSTSFTQGTLDGSSYAEMKLKGLLRASTLGHGKRVVEFV